MVINSALFKAGGTVSVPSLSYWCVDPTSVLRGVVPEMDFRKLVLCVRIGRS